MPLNFDCLRVRQRTRLTSETALAERAETGFVNSASTRPRSRHKAKLNRLVHLRALDLASSFICDLVLHHGLLEAAEKATSAKSWLPPTPLARAS